MKDSYTQPLSDSTKIPPDDMFREIGIDTEMWPDQFQETIFFLKPGWVDEPAEGRRMDNVNPEAVAEFIEYWEHQIGLARKYVQNGCNANANEWAP